MAGKSSEELKEYQKAFRQNKLAAGLCPCGKPLEPNATYCSNCRKRQIQWIAAARTERRKSGLCICGTKIDSGRSCQACLDKSKARCKTYRQKLREEVFEIYGKTCACCGQDELAFLVIDHIDGGGNLHRKEISGSKSSGGGVNMYRWLRKNNYPKGFQTLCQNCNSAKGIYGVCPHQTAKEANAS